MVAVGGTPAPSGDLNVTWSAPASSGLGTIVSYTATAKPSSGSNKTCTSTSVAPATPALACQVTGATNGTSYTVTVTATNSVGTAYISVASAPSAAAFPSTTFGAPTIGTATGGFQQATVSWTAPAALAGTQPALTGYVVTPFIGTTAQPAQTFNSTATTETLTGLTGGHSVHLHGGRHQRQRHRHRLGQVEQRLGDRDPRRPDRRRGHGRRTRRPPSRWTAWSQRVARRPPRTR